MIFVGGEENIVEREAEPVDQTAKRPNNVKEKQEDQAFSCEVSGGVFRCEEGTVERTPEQPEVIFHSGRDP